MRKALFDIRPSDQGEPKRPVSGVGSLILFFAFVFCVAAQAGPASAGEGQGPIYDPYSKSYFELVDDDSTPPWRRARQVANSKVYKGVRGRLAIIRDKKVHDFLKKNFQIPTEAWIGLRYWCRTRDLKWVDGQVHERREFNPWAARWVRNATIQCGTVSGHFMPVYYTANRNGFKWQASGPNKALRYSFVEYPTSEE